MEIRLRPLVVAFIVLTLVGGLGYCALPRVLPLAAELGLRSAATATVAAPVVVPTGGPEVTFLDESLGWDWDATCAPQLRRFLAEKLPGRRISSLQVVLVDYNLDRVLPFGVRYPDQAGPQADANCYDLGPQTDGGSHYTCSVGVARGEPGADLDVAATLAAPYTLLDMFLARGANPNAVRQTWKWGTFQPLIAPLKDTENRWQSTCLRISRAP
ncbi:MAG: hypothetical protein FJZ97_10850 [Chloroflexi bacterium]|nr:hypothetical protein [Chloroflexota bacterium]